MSDTKYTPPKVWVWDKESGGKFANINRPIAGSTHDKELPVGEHPLQLYSLATPNGVKVTVRLEELHALGHTTPLQCSGLLRSRACLGIAGHTSTRPMWRIVLGGGAEKFNAAMETAWGTPVDFSTVRPI